MFGLGMGLATPSPSTAKANERVDLYLYPPLGLTGPYRVPFLRYVIPFNSFSNLEGLFYF
jgi:hypothetical protein